MSNPKKYTVTSGLDNNYVFPFLVMAFSASRNSNFPFHFKIAFAENLLSKANRQLISEVLTELRVSFEFIAIVLSSRLKSQDHIQITAFSRLYLADILSENFLWLDCDLICESGWDNIFTEYETFLKDSAVCAAVDAIVLTNRTKENMHANNKAIELLGHNYFNSGVMLVNPEIWRALNEKQSWEKLYDSYGEFGFQYSDQCVINYMCHESHYHLEKSYNVYANIRKRYVPPGDTKILHFPGSDKPWTYKKSDIAILFSGIKSLHIYRYLNVVSNLLIYIERNNFELSYSLRTMQKKLHQKRTLLYCMRKLLHKVRRNNPSN